MPPLFDVAVDLSPLRQAFADLPAALQLRLNEAARVTAEAIIAEAKGRLSRSIKGTSHATSSRPDEGQNLTLQGLHAQPAYDGNGYVVLSDREPFPNVPLFLEKGTHPGKRHNFARTDPEPFFYSSIVLEVGAHEQRVEDAMRDAAEESGLGS